MTTRCAVWLGVCVALLGVGLLGVGAAQAQEIRDRETLRVESARVARLRQEGKSAEALSIARRMAAAAEQLLGTGAAETGTYLTWLSLLYQDLGQYAKAEPLFQRSLRIFEAQNGKDHTEVATGLNNLAVLYKDMGKCAQAEPLFRRRLRIYEDNLGPDHVSVALSLDNLAQLYRLMSQYAQAERLFQRGLQIREAQPVKDHPHLATNLSNLAWLYKDQGRYAQAEPLFRRSLRIYEAKLGQDHPDAVQSLQLLAELLEAAEQTVAAADVTDRARRGSRRHSTHVLTALSEKGQADFLRHRDLANWHIALSLGLRHPDDTQLAGLSATWLVNGKGVAQQTLAHTALLARDSRDPKVRQLSQSLQQTRQELARLTLNLPPEGQMQQRQRRLDELNQQEQDRAKQLRQAGGGGEEAWVELDTLRQALPKDAVLIELARFDVFDFKAIKEQKQWQPTRYAAWIIPTTGPVRVLDLGPADPIDAAVQHVRQALQEAQKTNRLKGEADAETALRAPLAELAQKVLHPLLPHIGQAQRWIVSPDGSLWLIPWAALPLPDGTYAVESHTISYAISGRDLLDAAPAKVKATAPLVLANPDFDLSLDQVDLATRRLVRDQEAPAETRGLSRTLPLGRIKRLPGTAT
jgi:tetratricopeptide (TPR) repeat protein